MLRLLSMQLDRGLWASEPETTSESRPWTRVSLEDWRDGGVSESDMQPDDGAAHYRMFRDALYDRDGKGQPYTEDVRQTVAYWEEQARDFLVPSFWEDKQIMQASLKSALTLLRLLINQLSQAIEANQRENEAK